MRFQAPLENKSAQLEIVVQDQFGWKHTTKSIKNLNIIHLNGLM